MSHQDVMLQVRIAEGNKGERVEELSSNQAPIKIGRLSSSHLRFEDASVSRIHAVIERGGDGALSLIDLGSASGTYVNGERITKQAVGHGDVLKFGDVEATLELYMPQAEAPAKAAIAAPTFVDEATQVTSGVAAISEQAHHVAAQQPSWEEPISPQSEVATPSAAPSEGMVMAADGTPVEPYTLQGYYDEGGNYLPGYYDEAGDYHLGYGYYDEQGQWCVAAGYYDGEGTWVETEQPIASLEEVGWQGPSSIEYYSEAFFSGAGGDTLEVAMLWADQVLSVTSYPKAKSVVVGTSPQADFVIEDGALSSAAHPLVSHDGAGGYQLVVTEAMGGVVQNGEQRYTLQEMIEQGLARQSGVVPQGYAIALGSRTSARVDIGEVTFLIHFTEQPAVFWPMFTVGAAALSLLGFIALSGLLQGSFVALALTSPIDPNGLELDAFSADDRFVQAMILPEQEEEEEMEEEDGDGEEAAAKHAGEEGQAGKEDSEQVNKELAIKGPEDNQDLELKKSVDTQVAMDSGALAVMGDMVSSPFGTASESVGSDAIHALGNLEGDGVGEARGFGGLGMAGAGRGGGGVSERGLGLANVGTRGKGGRGGGGSGGYGGSAGDLGKKKGLVPKLVPGKPKVVGSLDKEIIRRVVRRHRSEIRYCYEKELQKNPKLAGTVTMKFVIAGTGSVMTAAVSSTDLNNSAVESCMANKIRKWDFPEPKGGGIVNVNYPFKFSS